MKKLNLPIVKIIELYESGLSCYKIAKIFNCSASSINNILKKGNINTSKNSNNYRKYKLNQNYFSKIDTEDKAYFLGLIYSDGCVYKGRLSISLIDTDAYILEKFLYFLESEGRLYDVPIRRDNTQAQKMLAISNNKIKEDLEYLGVTEKKSLTLKFPSYNQVPIKFMRHFIRGVFDGDGSVFSYERNINKNKYVEYGVSIISSVKFIEELRVFIGYGNVYNVNNNKNSFISFKDRKEIISFYNYIYKDSKVYLNRKYKKMSEIVTELNNKKYFYGGEKIIQTDLNGNTIKIWDNIKELKDKTDYNTQTILRNIRGKIKTSNNYIFKLYDK